MRGGHLRLAVNSIRKALTAACIFGVCVSAVQPQSAQAGPSPSTKASSSNKKKKAAHAKKRGQQKIDPARAREIQEALIREHYLTGKATGKWDDTTQTAMRRYQSDHGWQAKVIPDSRALIKLGLGPDHEHLLNPQTAMTGQSGASSAAAEPDSPTGEPRGRNH